MQDRRKLRGIFDDQVLDGEQPFFRRARRPISRGTTRFDDGRRLLRQIEVFNNTLDGAERAIRMYMSIRTSQIISTYFRSSSSAVQNRQAQ
jgi:hypothetical protein